MCQGKDTSGLSSLNIRSPSRFKWSVLVVPNVVLRSLDPNISREGQRYFLLPGDYVKNWGNSDSKKSTFHSYDFGVNSSTKTPKLSIMVTHDTCHSFPTKNKVRDSYRRTRDSSVFPLSSLLYLGVLSNPTRNLTPSHTLPLLLLTFLLLSPSIQSHSFSVFPSFSRTELGLLFL